MFNHKKFAFSFKYAIEGIIFAVRFNQNLWFHFAAAIVVIILSLIFRVTPFEKGILGVMILLVICAEMINTAIEEMTDLIVKEHRQEAKIAKDVAAGMVLLTAMGSVIVGILIFLPYFLRLFSV